MFRFRVVPGCALLLTCCLQARSSAQDTVRSNESGLLSHSTDISSSDPGFTKYDPVTQTYRIGGGGADLWGTADHFRFAWTRISGDATLSADVHIDGPVAHPLAKAMLMFRQSLDPGSPYADIALHADGHITLQYRESVDGLTKDTVLPQRNVKSLRITRQGNTYTVHAGTELNGNAASIQIPIQDPAYVGLGVCSHNTDTFQVVSFSNVQLTSGR